MKKIYKLFIALMAFVMIITLSSCLSSPVNDDELNLVEKSVTFTNLSKDYEVGDSEVKLYFYENGNVPLINVSSYYGMLEGYYENSKRTVSTNTYFNRLYITDKDYSYRRVIFDWRYNTVTFKNTVNVYSTYSHGSIDFNAYYDLAIAKGLTSLDIEYYFGNYDIDILFYKGNVLMPVSAINFMNGDYYNVIYNGVKLYGFYYGDNTDSVYSEATMTGEIPEDIKTETKNELLFLLNEKYGLKDYSNVSDYKDVLGEELLNQFMGNSDQRDDAYLKIIHTLLNDPHSRMQKLSFYHDSTKSISTADYEGENSRYNKIRDVFTDLRGKYSESEVFKNPDTNNLTLFKDSDGAQSYIYYKGNTMFISFQNFLMGNKDQVYKDEGGYKDTAYIYSTAALFYKALTDAKDNHPNVKNVVVDVSINGGGYVAACYKILSFISDNIYFGYSIDKNNTEVYKIMGDTNMDGKYSGNESFSNFNYYVLESEGTFSAANAFACFSKYSGSVKTIGKRSGGGMCAVMPYVLTDGTRFNLSDKSAQMAVQSLEREFVVYSIEGGAPVDIPLEYEDFYNFEKIVELINQ